jgi:hypothetical protein
LARDFVSHLRYDSTDPLSQSAPTLEIAFGHGVSQSGRYLRQFVYEGLNVDESGRVVFDGILPHIAGARRGEFNSRYAQPSHLGYNDPSVLPPYSIDEPSGLFDNQMRLGGVPKAILTNTSFEYWRGDACFNHIDPATDADRREGTGHRSYLFAGIDHLGDAPAKAELPLANPPNPLSYVMLLRAAFSNLTSWVEHGIDPPPSRVPRVGDHSAALREEILLAFATLPSAVLPDAQLLPVSRPTDLGPTASAGVAHWPPNDGRAFTTFVASIDNDGNEIAGIRLPEIAAPVATYTAWTTPPRERHQSHPLQEFAGARYAFAPTKSARLAVRDPRPSIEERYPIRAEYERLAADVVDRLIAERFLLKTDGPLALQNALAAYDELVSS